MSRRKSITPSNISRTLIDDVDEHDEAEAESSEESLIISTPAPGVVPVPVVRKVIPASYLPLPPVPIPDWAKPKAAKALK